MRSTRSTLTCQAAALAVFVSVSLYWQSAWANDKTPVWYSYFLAGQQADKAKNYPISERYYLGALAELEKLAAKKQRVQLPFEQERDLGVFYAFINQPFREEYMAKSREPQRNRAEELPVARFPKMDPARASDPAYLEEFQKQVQAEAARVSKQADEQKTRLNSKLSSIQQGSVAFKRDEAARTRRVLAVYEVLLGPNSDRTRACRDSLKQVQE
jgi:hypothetical protein